MKNKLRIHPNSISANSAQAMRTRAWCKQLEKIVIRVMKCEAVEDFNAAQEEAFNIRDDIASYAEHYTACGVASRRITEAFSAPSKQETLEHLAEVGFWLNTIGLSPYMSAK